METFLGIPLQGWTSLSIWIFVLVAPWTYVLYFLWRIDRSGVERWGAKPRSDSPPGGAGGGSTRKHGDRPTRSDQ